MGIGLPKEQMNQLWALADEDGQGTLDYVEFAKRFSKFKASRSLHRSASAGRVPVERKSQGLSWGASDSKLTHEDVVGAGGRGGWG